MSDTTNRTETLLIREGMLLPAGLAVESEVFLPGWKVVKNIDRSTLARNTEGAKRNFFYLAGEIRSYRLGSRPVRNPVEGTEVCCGEAGGAEV